MRNGTASIIGLSQTRDLHRMIRMLNWSATRTTPVLMEVMQPMLVWIWKNASVIRKVDVYFIACLRKAMARSNPVNIGDFCATHAILEQRRECAKKELSAMSQEDAQ